MPATAPRTLVVEADGGSRGNPGPAGYGACVLDPDTGETLAEAAAYLGRVTNNVAEYRGLIAGLRAARALDPEALVRVRMDSKLVVEQMSGRWRIKHPDMQPLAAEARTLFPAGRVTYQWIPREQNGHADRLANEAMDAGQAGRQWEPGGTRAAGAASAASAASGTPGVDAAPAVGAGVHAGPADTVRAIRTPVGTTSAGSRPVGTTSADTPSAGRVSAGTVPAGTVRAGTTSSAETAGWGAAMGAPAVFVLLRHGETALTPQKRFSGSGGSDPELSETGRRQAEQAAAALAARGTVQAIVSSPLARCRQTAGAVAARLGLDVSIDEGLRETDFGSWEGLTFAEVKDRHPGELDAWLASPAVAPPGGESFDAVAHRVALSRDALLARHPGRTVLLVSHVTPVKTLVRLALGAPPESLFRMELSAASLSTVAYYADGNASLRALNDTGHLR